MSIEVDFSGVNKKAQNFSASISDFTDVLTEIKTDSHAEIFKQLNSGGKPRFVKLSKRYEALKIKRWGQKPILTASGNMRVAYSQSGEVTENEFALFPPNVIAASHQKGTARLPKRPIDLLRVQTQGVRKVLKAIDLKLKQSGL